MRNRKLLYVLIPIIVLMLVLIAGVTFLKINSSAEKIFKTAINRVFNVFETSDEKFSTMKGNINLTARIQSDNEEMQEINRMLEWTNIGIDMEIDTENKIVNEQINVILNNESLLDAAVVVQDRKAYLYFPDWLNKYIELPDEYIDLSDLTESYNKINTLNQRDLMEAMKEELIATISKQELMQSDVTLLLDGQETKVTASTLSLKNKSVTDFYNELFSNLVSNEKFLLALGEYKEDVQMVINDMLVDMGDVEDVGIDITIYTKGLFNEFVGIAGSAIDYYFEEEVGFEILKQNDSKYDVKFYEEYEGEREEEITITCNYRKKDDKTSFNAKTNIDGIPLMVVGDIVTKGKNPKGNITISIEEETIGSVSLICNYNSVYDEKIEKVDTGSAVLIDELSEEDKRTFLTKIQNSLLYRLISQSDGLVSSLGGLGNKPEVTQGGYTVKYNVPNGFKASTYNSEDYKMYMDDNFNSIKATINDGTVNEYLNGLENEYVLESNSYKNQQISTAKSININGREYKFRTITYNDDFGSFVNLYFACELDNEYCYVVEVESEGGKISMDTIKNFLNIIIE